MNGRRLATLVASLLIGWMAASRFGIYRVRLLAGQLLAAVPDAAMPRHFSVLPPPAPEYVGVWEIDPTEARRRLRSEFGFRRLLRASVPHKASSASCFCGLSSVSKRLY
jgi:hypothetical protein